MWGTEFPFSFDIPQQFKGERPPEGNFIQVIGCDVGGGGAVRQTHIQVLHFWLWHIVIYVRHLDFQSRCACKRRLPCPRLKIRYWMKQFLSKNMKYVLCVYAGCYSMNLTVIHCKQCDIVETIDNIIRFSVSWFDCGDFACVGIYRHPASRIMSHLVPADRYLWWRGRWGKSPA